MTVSKRKQMRPGGVLAVVQASNTPFDATATITADNVQDAIESLDNIAIWTVGTSLSYTAGTLDAIQDIRTSATPGWSGITSTKNDIQTTVTAGMTLRNTTPATVGVTNQFSPALVFSGRSWVSSADTEKSWRIYSQSHPSSNHPELSFEYKIGAGNWTKVFDIITSGVEMTASGLGETRAHRLTIYNSSSSSSGGDQFTPTVRFISTGWKTEETAASQIMAAEVLNAPQQGTISPVGVHKMIYGTGAFASTLTNEIYRAQWGSDAGVLGFILNDLALAGYTFRVEGNSDANLIFTDGTNNRVGIGTATPGYKLDVAGDINSTGVLRISGTTVIGAQGAAVANATDAASVILRLNDLLARCRAHGLIAS